MAKRKMTADITQLSVDTIRCLSADTVQRAKSGHPGAPMGCAPMGHLLFSRVMRFNPANPKWPARDRFVLSNGHGCALLYVLLHLSGFKLSLDDLRNFRQLNSKTPGHPEAHVTEGVDVSTGPLGQGISNAVGLAIAEAQLAASFNRPGFPLFDNYTYVITGDGCLQEGVAAEACSLAGHLKLGKLIVLYDANKIQIDGSTDLAFTEDVLQRFASYGWHTSSVENGDHAVDEIGDAVAAAKKVTDKPSLIKITTTIGFGSKMQGTEKVHGAPLGDADIAEIKNKFGLPADKTFYVPDEVAQHYKSVRQRGADAEQKWNELVAQYTAKFPDLAKELKRRISGALPADWKAALPQYKPTDAAQATRKLSETLLNSVAGKLPELVGGSADLTHSNLTKWKDSIDFQHESTKLGTYAGRYLRFGVREHGMAAICNGIAAYGMGFIPFASTFLNFISYALGAVRLSALSHHQVVYIMTHDSIGLGEDGPTHQPVETLASLRALPGILVFRPADGNEVSGAYAAAIADRKHPSVLSLTRQNLPQLEGSSMDKVAQGAYVLHESAGAHITLVATGSEVSLAFDAAKKLADAHSIKARVVSMPCMELFNSQPTDYKRGVLSPAGAPILSIEAATTFGWAKYAHAHCGVDTFGASAPYTDVYKFFKLTPDDVAARAKQTVEFYKGKPVADLVSKPF